MLNVRYANVIALLQYKPIHEKKSYIFSNKPNIIIISNQCYGNQFKLFIKYMCEMDLG